MGFLSPCFALALLKFHVIYDQAVWPHSGHYRPTEENFKDFVSFLEENNVDLADVKVYLNIVLSINVIRGF